MKFSYSYTPLVFNTDDGVHLLRVVLCTDAVILSNCVIAFNYPEVGGHLSVRLDRLLIALVCLCKHAFKSHTDRHILTDLTSWGHLPGPNKEN